MFPIDRPTLPGCGRQSGISRHLPSVVEVSKESFGPQECCNLWPDPLHLSKHRRRRGSAVLLRLNQDIPLRLDSLQLGQDAFEPIEFTLETRHGPEVWTIDCSETGAKARRAASPDAKLHVDAKLADFLRVGVGEIAAPSAVLSGKLNVRGDFGLALKMGEMFGGPSVL